MTDHFFSRRIYISGMLLSAFLWILSGCQNQHELSYHLADYEESQEIISTSDAFTRSLNEFDLVSRLQDQGMEPTEENYLELCKESVLEWTGFEREVLTQSAKRLQKKIDSAGYRLPLPQDITIVKTTMVEEGGAGGYTRGTCIFLEPLETITPAHYSNLDLLLAHELFHVLTRNCPEFRKAMYHEIGFELLEEDIDFGEELEQIRITNPDVNRYDHYSYFTIDGKRTPCAMWFHTTKEYEGGPFYMYGIPSLVPLDENFHPILNEDGSPLLYNPNKVEDFYNLIGKNTHYIINPEEALADNFAFALTGFFPEGQPDPEVTERLRHVMKGSWKK